jgi:phosphoribosylglycinamide formyltransferase 2
MKFGTPLTNTATKVMLLGSGELGKEVAISLQRFGVEVIAVDRYANAPAHQVAHRAHVINMSNPEELRALIMAERPHFIVPEIEAIATQTLLEIEQAGISNIVPTARAVNLTMNREGIRCLAAEVLQLPTSPYAFADSLEQLQAAAKTIGFPCFIKPVMSSSGKGQSKVDSVEELSAAWDCAISSGRVNHGKVIIEGMIDFEFEITLLTVRAVGANAQVHTFFCDAIGHKQVAGDYVESWQPQAMSEIALAKARDIADKVTTNLGGRGIFGVELFVKGDEVWFSEVSPRPHDTGLVTLASQYQSEFEIHARAILGLPVNTACHSVAASAVIYGELEAQGIAFEGVAEALQVPNSDLRLFGKPESFAKRRMGVALCRANNIDEARANARVSAACVKPVLSS